MVLLCLRPRHSAASPVLAAVFAAGIGLAALAEHPPLTQENTPTWVRLAVTPAGKATDRSFTEGVAVTGTIREATPLADSRMRFLLGDVRTQNPDDAPLPGLLVLTWRDPPAGLAAAGPGQQLTATLRLREIHGFANPGVWETETYWRDRGAYFRAWSRDDGSRKGKAAPFALSGTASTWWMARETLRKQVVAVLATANPNTEPGVSGYSGTSSRPSVPALLPESAMIPALLFGDRSLCPPDMLDLVARSTLAHSLALSGMHLGFATGLAYALAFIPGMLWRGASLRLPRQKLTVCIALPLCLGYIWLGGAPPSLIRAALMYGFWGLLIMRGHTKVFSDGFLWAAAVIVAANPAALYDIRLQLSFLSVAGIALAMPLIAPMARIAYGTPEEHKAPRKGKPRQTPLPSILKVLPRPVARVIYVYILTASIMMVTTIAAQAAILPLLLDAFPGTGVWFPLNLLWLPVLGMWVMPLAFLGLGFTALSFLSSGFLPLASGAFQLAEIPCALLVRLLALMENADILAAPVALRPEWPSWAGYWLLLLLIPAVYAARGFTRRLAVLAVAALVLLTGPGVYAAATSSADTVSLTLIDVGQGQAALITWQGERGAGRALVDGGGFGGSAFDVGKQVISPVLTRAMPPDIDIIINSHPDADHLQGLLFPIQAFRRVGGYVRGPEEGLKQTATMARRDALLRKRGIPIQTVRAGSVLTLAPGLLLEVLHPMEDTSKTSNDGALVLRLVRDGKPLALICGDIERSGIAQLLATKTDMRAEVLVLPHHGSAGSFSPALYAAAAPTIALASCGYANAWHFPADKVRNELAQRAIPLETTADRGQIRVTWRANDTMSVSFAREKTPGAQ